ncbi:MAG: hypothetical protein OEV49_03595 [candidate division Zixibacteria bacterium]|nr:hypothetical protein [candidate division Zixibacteria bacterium]MDH3937829.1 hypothetical protein [candidate division Zixibacteria bacterium]
MRTVVKVFGFFLGMVVCGFLLPYMPGGSVMATDDCGLGCSGGGGTCDSLPPPGHRFVYTCCGGYCSSYPGDDPVWICAGQCSVTGDYCNCTQVACHNNCGG